MFSVLPGRVRGAATAGGEPKSLPHLLRHCQHERGVPAGPRSVHVPLSGVVATALLQQAPHDLWVPDGLVVEIVPLEWVAAEL